MPSLIVFIDSFPHRYLDRCPFLGGLHTSQLRPGIGYSVNIHSELFAGLTPDQVGFLNIWGYHPNSNDRLFYRLMGAVPLRKVSVLGDRLVHYLWDKLTKNQSGFVPWHVLPHFAAEGVDVFDDRYPHPSIFSGHEFRMVFSPESDYEKGKGDAPAILRATGLVRSKTPYVFCSLCDLDAIGHKFGATSSEYLQKVKELDCSLQSLHREFKRAWPDGDFIVLSDHGMSDMVKGVALDLEKQFGRQDPKHYVYYYDSVMLKLWYGDPSLKSSIESHLEAMGVGSVLSEADRHRFGVTSTAFGHTIFLLHDGYGFAPNYFMRRLVRGFHGYHPDTPSQLGIFVTDSPVGKPLHDLTAREAYQVMLSLLEGSSNSEEGAAGEA